MAMQRATSTASEEEADLGAEHAVLRYAPALAASFCFVVVLVAAGYYLLLGATEQLLLWVVCGAIYLPGYMYVVHRSASGATPRHREWILAVTAAIVFGLPVIGFRGAAALTPFVVVAFITLPWGRALGLAALALLVTVGFEILQGGGPGVAAWIAVSVVWQAASLYTIIWVVRVTRSLHEFRAALAARTLTLERAERSSELQSTLGTALDDLVARGERTQALLVHGAADVRSAIEDMGTLARRTLSDTRRMIAELSRHSVRSELDNASALLAAVGVDSTVRTDGPATSADESQVRERLRSSVADLLAAPPPAGIRVEIDGTNGTIAVSPDPQVGEAT